MLSSLLLTLAVVVTSVNHIVPGAISVSLASHSMPLNDRYGNAFVNDVFKDNILLTMNYMEETVKSKNDISWDKVENPFHYEFTLDKGAVFAFHDQVLPEYKDLVVKTTNAHFNFQDGFKSDGYLTGDGVCHLASLIYWVAKDAGLEAYAPRNHDFAKIPDIPKEYGVAIYAYPGQAASSSLENLYITNNKENPVRFVFDYKDDVLTLSISATS